MDHNNKIETIIFDFGGVLIDWNPRHLYRKILKSEEEITWFLENVCTMAWNDEQDAGRSFEEATDELLKKFPEHEVAIRAWYGRWQETIGGAITDTVHLLEKLKATQKYRIYGLTNWSAETFPWALNNFDFLHWFDGVLVSGVEKTRKPFPEIYNLLLSRYDIDPAKAIFIDDNIKNIEGARTVGLPAIHFTTAAKLKEELMNKGVEFV